MMRFFRFILIVVALAFIFGNVYLATKPSIKIYLNKISYKDFDKQSIQDQIIDFSNWENWVSTSFAEIEVIELKKSKISQLKVIINDKEHFSVENLIKTDTLLVQKVYGFGGKQASEFQWEFTKEKDLIFRIQERLSLKEKLLSSFKVISPRRIYLNNLTKSIVNLKKEARLKRKIKISSLEELNDSISVIQNKSNVIRLPKQN